MSLPDLWSPDALLPPARTFSRFKPVRRFAVVPINRFPKKPQPIVWLDQFFPFPAVRVHYIEDAMLAVDEFIDAVCIRYDITRQELTGDGRQQRLIIARREVAEELSRRGWSTPQIGRCLNRDHSSIVYLLGRRANNEKRRKARERGEA